MGMHRSERGDVSLEPAMVVAMMVFVPLLASVIISSILRDGVLDTVAYALVGSLGLVGIGALLAWADHRRLARPVAPFRWARPQRHELLTVELPSGARLLSDGIDLVVDSTSPGTDAEAVLEDWRLARPDRLPPVLAEAARARWASLDFGLHGRELDRWFEGIDRLQEDLDRIEEGASTDELLLWAAITPQAEQAAWWSALGQAPTPEDMGELLEAGVRGGDDAAALNRPGFRGHS